jgi:hypothetical protein
MGTSWLRNLEKIGPCHWRYQWIRTPVESCEVQGNKQRLGHSLASIGAFAEIITFAVNASILGARARQDQARLQRHDESWGPGGVYPPRSWLRLAGLLGRFSLGNEARVENNTCPQLSSDRSDELQSQSDINGVVTSARIVIFRQALVWTSP